MKENLNFKEILILDQTGSGFKDTDPTRTWICNPDSGVKFLILKRYKLNAAIKGMDGLFKGEGALHIQHLHTAHKVKLGHYSNSSKILY